MTAELETVCKMCANPLPASARVCSKCGTFRKAPFLRYLGASIPLIAATASTLLLLGNLLFDYFDPDRASLVIASSTPPYSRDAIHFDIANLTEVSMKLPSWIGCSVSGDEQFIDSIAGTRNGTGTSAQAIFTFARSESSALGLRNESARVSYERDPEEWIHGGGGSIDGEMECLLSFQDRVGDLPALHRKYAFRIVADTVLFYDVSEIVNAEGPTHPGLMFNAQRRLLE